MDCRTRTSSDNVFTNEKDDARNAAVVTSAFTRVKHKLWTTLRNRFLTMRMRAIEHVFVQLKIAQN